MAPTKKRSPIWNGWLGYRYSSSGIHRVTMAKSNDKGLPESVSRDKRQWWVAAISCEDFRNRKKGSGIPRPREYGSLTIRSFVTFPSCWVSDISIWLIVDTASEFYEHKGFSLQYSSPHNNTFPYARILSLNQGPFHTDRILSWYLYAHHRWRRQSQAAQLFRQPAEHYESR